MPHPKRKHSKQRRDLRRSHDGLTAPTVTTCSNCGAPVQSHRVCPECGYYKGKPAIEHKETI